MLIFDKKHINARNNYYKVKTIIDINSFAVTYLNLIFTSFILICYCQDLKVKADKLEFIGWEQE